MGLPSAPPSLTYGRPNEVLGEATAWWGGGIPLCPGQSARQGAVHGNSETIINSIKLLLFMPWPPPSQGAPPVPTFSSERLGSGSQESMPRGRGEDLDPPEKGSLLHAPQVRAQGVSRITLRPGCKACSLCHSSCLLSAWSVSSGFEPGAWKLRGPGE